MQKYIVISTHVAREFNRRYVGKSVTAQAVRNWINGEAIPAGDKIRTLAKWLKASPHWLHYGENEKNAVALTDLVPAPHQMMNVAATLSVPSLQLSPALSRKRARVTRYRYASFTVRIEEKSGAYREDALTTLPEDFQRLAPKHKVMVRDRACVVAREEAVVHSHAVGLRIEVFGIFGGS